jgi:hypothetical protein
MSGLLPIFHDDDFVPHAYLDAIFQQLSKDDGGIDLTSLKDLGSLQSTTLSLLNQLDFLTKEITTELEVNVKALENTNSVISYSYQGNGEGSKTDSVGSKLKPTSKLEYYIDSLSIGIDSLNQEVTAISSQIGESSSIGDTAVPSKIKRLLSLSKSKENLQHVLKSLNTIKSIIDIAQTLDDSSSSDNNSNKTSNTRTAPTSTKNNSKQDELIKVIKPNEFQLAINVLKETIIDQFNTKLHNESDGVIDHEFLKKIADLIKISEVFKNFGRFYTIYNSFSSFLNTEMKNYLNGKKGETDNNDELFEEVLK